MTYSRYIHHSPDASPNGSGGGRQREPRMPGQNGSQQRQSDGSGQRSDSQASNFEKRLHLQNAATQLKLLEAKIRQATEAARRRADDERKSQSDD